MTSIPRISFCLASSRTLAIDKIKIGHRRLLKVKWIELPFFALLDRVAFFSQTSHQRSELHDRRHLQHRPAQHNRRLLQNRISRTLDHRRLLKDNNRVGLQPLASHRNQVKPPHQRHRNAQKLRHHRVRARKVLQLLNERHPTNKRNHRHQGR